jgi:hypothetical protein
MQRFKSIYRNKSLGIAAHLAEICVERVAKLHGKTLPHNYHEHDSYRELFANQLTAAKFLCKLYNPQAVLSALLECKTARSMRAPFLDPVIKRKQEEIEWLIRMAAKEDECESIAAGNPNPDWNAGPFLASTGAPLLPVKSLASKLDDL